MEKEICFLIPSMGGGGAEKVTMLVANELCMRGWKVRFLMMSVEGPYLKNLHPQIKIDKLKYTSITKNLFDIVRFLKKEKPPVFYSSMMYINVIACMAAKLAGFQGRLIISEHSHTSSSKKTNRSITSRVMRFTAGLVYKYADTVVCVSEGVKNDILQLYPSIKHAVVINNPVESLFSPDFVRRNKGYRLISMGRLDSDKNFKLLIDVFYKVVNEMQNDLNYELYILGEGYERENLESQVEQLGLQGQVLLPGFVAHPGELLQSSDLFVFTSRTEGFGNALVEALGCGIPVISTDCESGPAEILGNGKYGVLVPVDDKDALVKAVLSEIRSPNEVTIPSERFERAEEFSVKKIVNQYESVLLQQ